MPKVKRRYIILPILVIVALLLVDAFLIEPEWVKVRTISLNEKPTLRLVHISDLHYTGDAEYLQKVVRMVNEQNADVVCITGDFVEDNDQLPDAIEILKGIKAPIIGVKGNHEDWAVVDEGPLKELCASSGGRWLSDQGFVFQSVGFWGQTAKDNKLQPAPMADVDKIVLLCHYPAVADHVKQRYDLMLAGHTHGGQIRLPLIGSPWIPYDSGAYDMGMFETGQGPVHVSPGIGTWFIHARLFCRPEITVFEL